MSIAEDAKRMEHLLLPKILAIDRFANGRRWGEAKNHTVVVRATLIGRAIDVPILSE